jgi:hypothetical protein
MTSTRRRPSVWLALLVSTIACTLAAVAVVWVPVPAAQAALPPRPTAQPTATAQATATVEARAKARPQVGAQIKLQVQFPAGWPWASAHWQDLWTVVQWQDAWGDWHTVEGWQGELDGVAIDDAGVVSGHKTWWVAEKDFGTGPFRWMVSQGKGGPLLAASQPFDLPSVNRATATAKVLLE